MRGEDLLSWAIAKYFHSYSRINMPKLTDQPERIVNNKWVLEIAAKPEPINRSY